jgi:hypothetical protein
VGQGAPRENAEGGIEPSRVIGREQGEGQSADREKNPGLQSPFLIESGLFLKVDQPREREYFRGVTNAFPALW